MALCEHKVPHDACVKCHPELVGNFKKIGDWCPEHDVPESQCLICHPDLKFFALPKIPEGADLKHLSRHGEDVPSLDEHAAPGKVTIFDFYAEWCAPCREIDRHVYRLLGSRQDIAYRKINIVSWDTPVAVRHMTSVATLPHVMVYGKDGKPVRAVSGLDLAALDAAIAEGVLR